MTSNDSSRGGAGARRNRLVIGLAAAAVAVAIVGYFWMQPASDPAGPDAAVATQSGGELMQEGPLPEMALGPDDAPVTIVEYSSLTCPHCASFHNNVLPELKSKYVETGKARYIIREFPLDNLAAAAFMVARCAGPDRYFPLVELMYEKQRDWAFGEGEAIDRLFDIAKQAGFSREGYEKCLADQELLDNISTVRERAAEGFGVTSTPTFFVNGKLLKGGRSVEDFEELMPPDVVG